MNPRIGGSHRGQAQALAMAVFGLASTLAVRAPISLTWERPERV
jgi:hypothetical protein